MAPRPQAPDIALFAEVHDALLDQVADLLQRAGPALAAGIIGLIDDLASDFGVEDDLMAALGCDSRAAHAAQHASLLASLRALPLGDAAACRAALAALPGWFEYHLDSWDTLLALALREAAQPI
jgi:hemerythrin